MKSHDEVASVFEFGYNSGANEAGGPYNKHAPVGSHIVLRPGNGVWGHRWDAYVRMTVRQKTLPQSVVMRSAESRTVIEVHIIPLPL